MREWVKDKGYFSQVCLCKLISVLTLSLGIRVLSSSWFWGRETPSQKSIVCPALAGKGGIENSSCICWSSSQLPSALNNLYTKVSIFGVAFFFFLLVGHWSQTGTIVFPPTPTPANIQIAFTSLLVNISLAKFVLRLACIRTCKHYSGCVGGDWYLSLASGVKV